MRDSQWKNSPTCFLFKNSIQAVLHTLRESIELYEPWKSLIGIVGTRPGTEGVF